MTTRADARGWGPGWPRCQYDKWKTVTTPRGVRLSVHRDLAELVLLLIRETERRGYLLRAGQCWGSACRSIRGSSSPSNHSWGLAIDINAPANPMTSRLVTDMPGWMPNLWNSYGFRWGGDYSGRKDAMHYEFLGTPADAKTYTEKARRELGGLEEDDMFEKTDKERLERVEGAVFSKRDGVTYESTVILERMLKEIGAKLGLTFNKDGSVKE